MIPHNLKTQQIKTKAPPPDTENKNPTKDKIAHQKRKKRMIKTQISKRLKHSRKRTLQESSRYSKTTKEIKEHSKQTEHYIHHHTHPSSYSMTNINGCTLLNKAIISIIREWYNKFFHDENTTPIEP